MEKPVESSVDNNNLSPIAENYTPESQSASVEEIVDTSAPMDNIQSTSGEPISNESPMNVISPEEPKEIESPVVENPPFLQPTAFEKSKSTNKVSEGLRKAINLRKTLKHKKRDHYNRLSDTEKMEIKKTIIDNLIHVLRESTHKNMYTSHKKSIVKLRHTLNKHLDYIETKKKVKTVKKEAKNVKQAYSRRNKLLR